MDRPQKKMTWSVFVLFCLWLSTCISASIEITSFASTPLPPVENILQAQFTRVNGNAQKNSVLGIGDPNSWYSDFLSLPTVDFDGKIFRMWFTGRAKKDDLSVPYSSYEQIGLAISLDGINWTVEGLPIVRTVKRLG